jgi:hypothetical protein
MSLEHVVATMPIFFGGTLQNRGLMAQVYELDHDNRKMTFMAKYMLTLFAWRADEDRIACITRDDLYREFTPDIGFWPSKVERYVAFLKRRGYLVETAPATFLVLPS